MLCVARKHHGTSTKLVGISQEVMVLMKPGVPIIAEVRPDLIPGVRLQRIELNIPHATGC